MRRTRLYGIGIGKTGTNSIYKMFSRNVRAVHEPGVLELIEKFIEWQKGKITDAQMTQFVLERDREMGIEVDASSMNILILEILLREFPDARFVLTIRDCYSWVNSMFNHLLRIQQGHPQWDELAKFEAGDQKFLHAPQEEILKQNNLQSLDWYFSRWALHNQKALAVVPPERMLIVRTNEIGQRAHEIADFARLPRWTIRPERTHSFQNPLRKELIHKIDREFLESKVQQHCRPLMTQFFPEIKSLDDAKL